MGWNKSYGAENNAWSGRFARHGSSQWANPDGVGLDEQTALVEKLRDEWPVPVEPILVERGREPAAAAAYKSSTRGKWRARIRLGASCGAGIVAHEFAHVVDPYPGHGPMWRRCYVEAVAILLGPWHSNRLLTRFEADGLDVDDMARFAGACRIVEAKARQAEETGVMMPPRAG